MAMTKQKTLVLVDGHALAYRMYFALERTQMQNEAGLPTWAPFGFFNAIYQLLEQRQPDALAFAFDVARESFRTRMYAEYKANRSSMPDDLSTQMDIIYEGIEALGLPVFRIPDVEADDVIGTLTKVVPEQYDDWNVDVLTGDQDSFQLVDREGRVNILIPSRNSRDGLKVYDWDAVVEKWNVTPEQVTDFKGLKGDASDNIPGVRGIGDKTGAKLLADYGTLENVLANLDNLKPAGVQKKMIDGQEIAKLSKQLAIIIRDVDVPFVLEDAKLDATKAEAETLGEFFKTYNFNTFSRNLPKWAKMLGMQGDLGNITQPVKTGGDVSTTLNLTNGAKQESLSYPAFEYETVTDIETLKGIFDEIRNGSKVCAFDVETTGLNVHDVDLVGFGLTWGKGLTRSEFTPANILNLKESPKGYAAVEPSPTTAFPLREREQDDFAIRNVYVPLRHKSLAETVEQVPYDEAFALLKDFLEDDNILKIIHNLKYERNCTRTWGISLKGPVLDTMIMSYVWKPEGKHGLKGLGERELNFAMNPISDLIGKGKKETTFDKVLIQDAAAYGASDTYATFCLAHLFATRFADAPEQASLFYEIENPLTWVLADLEYTGIRLNKEHLATLSTELNAQTKHLEKEMQACTEAPVNFNSPKQVGELLFDTLGLSTGRKTATKSYSTDSGVLEGIVHEHPIVQKLLDYRQLFKLQSTYVDNLPQLVKPETKRIHTSFNQTITATGRLSSSDPNLQNIPVRTEWGVRIREAFVPQDGWQLISADYSQIELRILAHLCQDKALLEAFNSGADIHTATAALVMGVPIDKVTKDDRYAAKAVNFGIVYGQTAHGLSQQLGITRYDAQQFIDKYFETYPGVQSFIKDTIAKAHETGQGGTMFGRVRNLKRDLDNRNKSIREFAERASFNTPVQGAAAELLKIAMLRLDKALKESGLQARMLLQVHDELVLEAPPEEVDATCTLIIEAMQCEQPLRVPLVIDTAVGNNWGEIG